MWYVWMYGVREKCMHEGMPYTHTYTRLKVPRAQRDLGRTGCTLRLALNPCLPVSHACTGTADSIIAGVTQLKEAWSRHASTVRSANECFRWVHVIDEI